MDVRPLALAAAGLLLLLAWLFRRRLGRWWCVVAVALAAVLAVHGTGIVQLPEPENAVAKVGTTLGAWKYALVGALAFLEAAAFVGLVAPGEFAVIFGGLIAGRGDIELLPLIAVVWVAALAGDLAGYAFGRAVGRGWALRHGRPFGVTPARLAWAEGYFASHGGKTIVLVGRFVGIVRALAPFIAGTSRMAFRRFALVDAVGAGLWATAFSLLGFACWQSIDRALELASRGKLGLGVVLLVALLTFAVYRLARDRRSRQRVRTWLRDAVAGSGARLPGWRERESARTSDAAPTASREASRRSAEREPDTLSTREECSAPVHSGAPPARPSA